MNKKTGALSIIWIRIAGFKDQQDFKDKEFKELIVDGWFRCGLSLLKLR